MPTEHGTLLNTGFVLQSGLMVGSCLTSPAYQHPCTVSDLLCHVLLALEPAAALDRLCVPRHHAYLLQNKSSKTQRQVLKDALDRTMWLKQFCYQKALPLDPASSRFIRDSNKTAVAVIEDA